MRKHYGKQAALNGIRFDIAPGRIVRADRTNGSGKTTTTRKAILGLTGFEGELSVLGRDPRLQRDAALMEDVCFIADSNHLPARLAARARRDQFCRRRASRFDRSKAERYLAHTKLAPKMRVKGMSKGMVVQLHLALVMAIGAGWCSMAHPGPRHPVPQAVYQNLLEGRLRREQDHHHHHAPDRRSRASSAT